MVALQLQAQEVVSEEEEEVSVVRAVGIQGIMPDRAAAAGTVEPEATPLVMIAQAAAVV